MELEEEEEELRRRRTQPPTPPQRQRQVIRWERFLPRRSLRVLLVENDDSTRHIVAALLRKCSYNVAAVADGVKAWAALQEKHCKIDLILSEVDMPSLSGIDFLDKVTSCDLSRNIPVIMMSSQDSVNVVFKCMLKGAADFLVKPVRRNELRNLWQHVWRKHCANGCNNPVERVNGNQTKPQDASGNDVSVNRDYSHEDNAHKNKDNGDDVRDTQSSCSKPGNEARLVQKCAELRSTVVKDSSGETLEKPFDSKAMIENSTMQGDYNRRVKEDKETGAGRKEGIRVRENCREVEESDGLLCMKEKSGFREEIGGNFYSSRPLYIVPNAQSAQTIDFIGYSTNEHRAFITLEKDARVNDDNKASDTLPSQGISVRRMINGFSNQGLQERHILKHSSASAFSRYGKDLIKSGTPPATLCISPKESTTRVQPSATQKEEVSSFPSRSLALSAGYETYIPRNHQVTSASGNNGIVNIKTRPVVEASSTSHSASQNEEHNVNHTLNQANNHNGVVTYHPSQIELMPYPFPAGQMPIQNLYAGYGAILQPMMYSEPSPSAPTIVRAVKEVAPSDHLGHQGNCPSYVSSEQNCIQYHLEHERKYNTIHRDQREPEAHICIEVGESTDKHNYCNGQLIRLGEDNGVANIAEYHGSLLIPTRPGNEDGFQNVNGGNFLDSGRSRREVAVMKFRQKRKERCFEKKVRYHSRKMLAEQRPRIKGQFVRISTVEPNTTTGEND